MAASDGPAALAAPPRGDAALMAVGLLAVSTSGPLMAATAAPALAIAFWRNAMASAVLLPWTLTTARHELRGLARREWVLAVLAGVLLAAHFATWVPSLDYTSVASATALVSTQPVWAALLARRTGHHIPARAWVGIAIAILGVALVTGVDVSLSSRALAGDVLAVAGGAFAAAYMDAGTRVRQTVSTGTYTTVCYATAAVALVATCLVGGLSLGGYPAGSWVKLVALTVGAQLLGHSVFNRVLRTTSPTVVSLTILLEVPGATLLAALWLGQQPHLAAVPGLVLLLAGIGFVVSGRDRGTPASVPVE